MSLYDVAIVGAGPVGLATAIACKRAGLSYVVLDKGCVVNAIFEYPTYMGFFTTAPELEIGNHPFVTGHDKPDRRDALMYYRLVTQREALNVEQYTEVTAVHAAPAGFTATPTPGPTQSQNRVLRFTGTLTANVAVTLPLPVNEMVLVPVAVSAALMAMLPP